MYYSLTIPFISIPSVIQEKKIWQVSPAPLSFWGITKVYILNVIWMYSALLGFIGLLPLWIIRGFGRSVQAKSFLIERLLAKMCVLSCICNDVIIEGGDNLSFISDDEPAPIYVANHFSQLDLAAVYFPLPKFKWIAKSSVQLLPGVGNIMFLSQHVFIQRSGNNSKSIAKFYSRGITAIKEEKTPIMIFPQGTRSFVKRLPFKNGAFNIALETKCKVVPLSIYIPPAIYNSWYPFNFLSSNKRMSITIRVHKVIDMQVGMDKEKLRGLCKYYIYSALPSLYDNRFV